MKKTWLGAVALGLLVAVACGSESADPTSEAPGSAGDAQGGAGDDEKPSHAGSKANDGGAGGEAPGNSGGMPQISDAGSAGTDLGGAGGAGGAPDTGPKLSPISGHIRTEGGTGLSGFVVVVNGVSTTTDEEGAFALEDVSGEFDLLAIGAEIKVAYLIEGLTARDVELGLAAVGSNNRRGTVAGKLSGGAGFPIPKGHAAQVAFSAASQDVLARLDFGLGHFAYNLAPAWEGPAQLPGELLALQWAQTAGVPTSYSGFARKAVTLEDGKDLGSAAGSNTTNLAFTKPTERKVAGTFSVAGKPSTVWTYLDLGRGLNIELPLKSGDISVVVPEVGLSTSLSAYAEYATGSSFVFVPVPEGDSGWDVHVPLPPTLAAPADKANNLPRDATFSWTKLPEGACAFVTWEMGDWTFRSLTKRTSAVVPDLSAYGIDVSGVEAGWDIAVYGGVDSVDSALPLLLDKSQAWLAGAHTFGQSPRRLFQFAK